MADAHGTSNRFRLQIFDKTNSLTFLIDTGADVSVLPKLHSNPKSSISTKLFAANGSSISTYGTQIVTVDLGLRRAFTWSFIVAEVTQAIIGADFIHHYGLLVNLRQSRLIDSMTHGSTHRQLFPTHSAYDRADKSIRRHSLQFRRYYTRH